MRLHAFATEQGPQRTGRRAPPIACATGSGTDDLHSDRECELEAAVNSSHCFIGPFSERPLSFSHGPCLQKATPVRLCAGPVSESGRDSLTPSPPLRDAGTPRCPRTPLASSIVRPRRRLAPTDSERQDPLLLSLPLRHPDPCRRRSGRRCSLQLVAKKTASNRTQLGRAPPTLWRPLVGHSRSVPSVEESPFDSA